MFSKQLIKDLERKHTELKAIVLRETKLKEEAEQDAYDYIQAQEIIQSIAQEIQQQAHDQIASVVSECLSYVFDEPYTFKIYFEKKRGRTEAQLVLLRDGVELRDPMDSTGGGVIDVAAFALRLSCLLLTKPHRRRLLVLDEPFRFLSVEYRGKVKGLLETLSKTHDVQIIMVTHSAELVVGDVIRVDEDCHLL